MSLTHEVVSGSSIGCGEGVVEGWLMIAVLYVLIAWKVHAVEVMERIEWSVASCRLASDGSLAVQVVEGRATFCSNE